MNILVINCGSSSLKYQLFDMINETVMAKGLVDRIGISQSFLRHQSGNKSEIEIITAIADHKVAIEMVLQALIDPISGAIQTMQAIDAIGHRVAHGGEKFLQSALITDEVKVALEECVEMAPLHNPANLIGIRACEELMPNIPMVGVFDTAFHQSMPKRAFLYGLPYRAYAKHGVRRYGFHGTSHKYVSLRAAKLIGKPIADLKLITCHLGNGASLAAIKYGESIDTSMGFTPLEGLIMGTRCGVIDPGIIPYLMKKENFTTEQISNYLNKQSGVLGISGVSSDFRDIEKAANNGNGRAAIALDIFAYNVKKFIGAYAVAMGGVDAIIFTAGVGENSISMREKICIGLEYLGTAISPERNNIRGKEHEISTPGAKVKLFVIPTNEELMIARDTKIIYDSHAN